MELGAEVKKGFLRWIAREPEGGRKTFWEMVEGRATSSPFVAVMGEARACLLRLGQAPETRKGDCDTNFRRMYAVASVLKDEDCEFLPELADTGVPIGVGVELPRNEAMFEEKVKWAREFSMRYGQRITLQRRRASSTSTAR